MTSERQLSRGVLSASIWQVGGKFGGRVFDFLTLVVLSRILPPADFGLVALAMTTVLITEAITSLPLMSAMIGFANPQRSMYDTAFTLALLRGLIIAVVLSIAAYAMSIIYADSRLFALVLVLSFAPILRGLMSPKLVDSMRRLDFRLLTSQELAGKVIAFLIATSIAVTTKSYWAIASATICTPLVIFAISYWFAPYRPRFSLSEWRHFRGFVGWNSVAQLFNAVSWQMDRLLLGRLIPKDGLGRFAMASDLTGILTQAIVVPSGAPMMAAYAKRKETPGAELRFLHLKAVNAIFAVAAPLYLGLALLAHQAVFIVLGPAWKETADILQWLALIAIIPLPVWHFGSLAIALGKVKFFAWRAIGEFAVLLPALLIGGLYFAIPGVIAARAISSVVVLVIGMAGVRKLIGCSFREQIWTVHRTVVALAVLATVVLLLRPFLADLNGTALVVFTGAVSLLGGFAYVLAQFVLWHIEGRPAGLESMLWEKLAKLFTFSRR